MSRARKPRPLFTVVLDSREQTPWEFAAPTAADFDDGGCYEDGLEAGDYTCELDGERQSVVIERKSLADFYMCVGRERQRFVEELGRLREYDAAHVLIEATFEQIAAGFERSRVTGEMAAKSAAHWETIYGIHFHFIGRRGAPRFARWLMEEFCKHRGNGDGDGQDSDS